MQPALDHQEARRDEPGEEDTHHHHHDARDLLEGPLVLAQGLAQTAGGGAEWAFSKIATLAMEYRHSEFDNVDSSYDPHHSPIFSHGNSLDLTSDQVTVKVNLLLGHMGLRH